MSNHYVIDCTTSGGGKTGGVILMWTNCVNLTIFDINTFFIDGYMSYFDQTHTCRFTCRYGYPNHKNTHLTYSIIYKNTSRSSP